MFSTNKSYFTTVPMFSVSPVTLHKKRRKKSAICLEGYDFDDVASFDCVDADTDKDEFFSMTYDLKLFFEEDKLQRQSLSH